MSKTAKPTFSVGENVRVIRNERNRTARTGTIREIIWHHKDQQFNYYIASNGKKISKRYFQEDLEPVVPGIEYTNNLGRLYRVSKRFRGPSVVIPYNLLEKQIESHPFPLLFATISGAHLYGFPSPDSDYDLRGAHLLPLEDVVGLNPGRETVEKSGIHDGLEIDLVTHDIKKFMGLLLKKNGYVLEQLLSPLVVHSTPEHEELKALAAQCITKHHAHHYLGFAATQWKLFQKEDPPRVKPLLYVYRVLLTGIHLMRTGKVEANLVRLNETAKLPYIPELIERKVSGTEKGTLDQADLAFHQREFDRLLGELETAHEESRLPERPTAGAVLNDLLVRVRLKSST